LAPFESLDHEQLGTGPGTRLLQTADGWLAVAAQGSDGTAALARAAGVTDPADVPAAVGRRGTADVLAALAAAGVPAEEVRREQRYPFFDDAANRAAGLVASYPHVEWGQFEQPGALWDFGDLEVRLDKAPPALGQHTVEVLEEVGVSREAIDRLLTDGIAAGLVVSG
jgi:hypothetical protein